MKTSNLISASLFATVLCSRLLCGVAHAQYVSSRSFTPTSQQADPRVRELLEQAEWRFVVSPHNDFQLNFDLDGRSHVAFVNSKTCDLAGVQIRHIWAVAIHLPGAVDEQLATRLLEENERTKIGAWHLVNVTGGRAAVFVAKVSAELDCQTFMTIVRAVAITADEMEKEITGEDRF